MVRRVGNPASTTAVLVQSSGVASVAVDCIALNYWSKHKRRMAIRGIN